MRILYNIDSASTDNKAQSLSRMKKLDSKGRIRKLGWDVIHSSRSRSAVLRRSSMGALNRVLTTVHTPGHPWHAQHARGNRRAKEQKSGQRSGTTTSPTNQA